MSRYRQPYSLYKRGKYWYYRTYDARGVRTVAKSTGCTSKARAREMLDNMYAVGGFNNSCVLFGSYAQGFFDDNSAYNKDRVKPLTTNTLIGYKISLNVYLLPRYSKTKIKDINYSELKRYRAELIESKSIYTALSVFTVLRIILQSAYRDRLITSNPFEFLDAVSVSDRQRDAFTLDEVKTLCNTENRDFNKFILLLALTGLRYSEAVGLTLEDIKTKGDLIYLDVYRQYNRENYIPLKTKETRQIPIIPEMKALIGNYLKMPRYYFSKPFNAIRKTFPDYEKRGLCFHSLRHFFITNTKSKGLPEVKVETLAGHSLKGISKVYTNFKIEDLIEVLQWQKETLSFLTGKE